VARNGEEKRLPGLDYSPEQLFFINYAQIWCQKITDQALESRILTGVHSPGEFRVIGPTSNSPFFSKVFNCKANQSNNPNNKCSVW
jgi:membrane metallo-endopeptidase-like protein 1